MKNPLVKVVKDFLSVHWKRSHPIMLGFSGGVDSSALFFLLIECFSFFDLDLHIVHFDHAWREESSLEASQIQKFIEKFSLPFHSERASLNGVHRSNLEDEARELRFAFFQKVYKKIGAQALLLAHQREDQAETVLKRLFEGAGVLSLGGMESCSLYNELVIWRPLLSVSRKDLCAWNLDKTWSPLEDRTNEDTRFLRPRMRRDLFPQLQQCFGKNVCHSLYRVSQELSSLKSFIKKRLSPYLAKEQIGTLGVSLPIGKFSDLDPWEKQELLRLFFKKHQVTFSYSACKTVLDLLESDAVCKEVDVSPGVLWIDRGVVFWWREEVPVFQGSQVFSGEGGRLSIQQGDWIWEIQTSTTPLRCSEGCLFYLFGEMSYRKRRDAPLVFSAYDSLSKKDQQKVSQHLSKNKVPSRLKRMFPYIINEKGFVCSSFCFDNDLKDNDFSDFSNIILKKCSELKDNIFPLCYASDV